MFNGNFQLYPRALISQKSILLQLFGDGLDNSEGKELAPSQSNLLFFFCYLTFQVLRTNVEMANLKNHDYRCMKSLMQIVRRE